MVQKRVLGLDSAKPAGFAEFSDRVDGLRKFFFAGAQSRDGDGMVTSVAGVGAYGRADFEPVANLLDE